RRLLRRGGELGQKLSVRQGGRAPQLEQRSPDGFIERAHVKPPDARANRLAARGATGPCPVSIAAGPLPLSLYRRAARLFATKRLPAMLPAGPAALPPPPCSEPIAPAASRRSHPGFVACCCASH